MDLPVDPVVVPGSQVEQRPQEQRVIAPALAVFGDQPPDMINSDDEDEEESPPVKHTKHSPPKIQQSEATEEIYSKFITMGRQFVAQLEDARKKEKQPKNPLISMTCRLRAETSWLSLRRANREK